MNVVFDGRPLLPLSSTLGPTGIGRWTEGAVDALARVAPEWNLIVATMGRDPIVPSRLERPNVGVRRLPFPERPYRWLRLLGMGPELERFVGDAQATIGSGFVTWKTRSAARLPVIHDLVFVRHPEFVSRRNLYFLKLMVPRVVRMADVIVTVSRAVGEEIEEHFRVSKDRIAVVPNRTDLLPERDGGTLDLGLPAGYVLCVGTLEPRKNIKGALAVHKRLRELVPDAPPLVVAGGPGWRTEAFDAELSHARAEGAVHLLGYVPDETLWLVYRNASALLFLSIYEGFGLPVLEAMAAGCPVVASDIPSVRETAGDAALLVDPADVEAVAAATASLLEDDTARNALIARGRTRASGYDWRRTGNALREAVERAVTR
jgi:glycosyltransferase involved in cell wall biosynthesis